MSAFIVILILIVLYLFAIYPATPRKEITESFNRLNCAHRGLYLVDQSIPENSLPAFKRAAERGYGVELDVQLTKDCEVVVFHDDTLIRACGVDGYLCDYTFDELQQFKLFNTEYTIPLFSDVLEVLEGSSPLICELKIVPNRDLLCAKTYALLKTFKSPYCIESMDPKTVGWFKSNAPSVMRGQLSENYKDCISEPMRPVPSFLLSRMMTNCIARPHFIAYGLGPKCLSAKISEKLGAFRVTWTVRPSNDIGSIEKTTDCIIFEHYLPEKKF